MRPTDPPTRLVLLGWATFLLMSILVVAVRGAEHLANMAVFAVVGAAMLVWVLLRRSRASLIVSLVLGVLHTVEQVAYLVAGLTADEVRVLDLVVDGVGLVSGLLLVVGSVQSLRSRREPSAQDETVLDASMPTRQSH